MATYDLTSSTPTKIKTGDIINCPYSGTYKTITLPKGTYKLEVWGGKGSANPGYATGTLTLSSKGNVLYLYSGGNASGTSGGWNGGGNGSTSSRPQLGNITYTSIGGGGGSDIRINGTTLYSRVIVAGGSGGIGGTADNGNTYNATAGAGGGTSGTAGGGYEGIYESATYGGKAGSTTAGGAAGTGGAAGSFGTGGAGSSTASLFGGGSGGGGGGGWYGGGSGGDGKYQYMASGGAGGGGSGYVYTSSTASNYPSGCLLNSSFYLTNASTTANVTTNPSTTGGYCRITAIEVKNCPFRAKINESTWKECQSAWLKINDTTWKELASAQLKLENIWSGPPPLQ